MLFPGKLIGVLGRDRWRFVGTHAKLEQDRKDDMRRTNRTKLVREGNYVAEVDVELVETDEDWSPYLSLEDAYKLDGVRDALRRGDLETATRLARVFLMTPVTLPQYPEGDSYQSDQR